MGAGPMKAGSMEAGPMGAGGGTRDGTGSGLSAGEGAHGVGNSSSGDCSGIHDTSAAAADVAMPPPLPRPPKHARDGDGAPATQHPKP